MDMAFGGVRVLVTDFARSFRFYHDVLGLPVHSGDENSEYASFEVPGPLLAIFSREGQAEAVGQTKTPPDAFSQDKVLLGFVVPSVDEAYRELMEKGVAFLGEPVDHPAWGIRSAYFRDPDGTLIEINQSLPGS